MNKWVNGKIISMSQEEEAVFLSEAKRMNASEYHRNLSATEVANLFLRQNIQFIQVDDATAVRMRDFYPEWASLIGQEVHKGFKFTYGPDLYRVIPKDHTFASQWIPGEGTESLYELIPEFFAGDEYDPIPYKGNMALEDGKYYTQDGVMYRCTRSSGAPVFNPLAELAPLYVQAIEMVAV